MSSVPELRSQQSDQAGFVERSACVNCGSRNLVSLSSGRYVDQPLAGFIGNDPAGVDRLAHLQQAVWEFVRCGDCNQMFHRFILNDEWNEKQFNEWMTAGAMREFERRVGSNTPSDKFYRARERAAHVLRIDKLTRSLRTDNEPVRLLDFGCGWGVFVAMCEQFGFDAVGIDRSTQRAQSGATKILPSLSELGERPKFHAITAFEVFEHLPSPATQLDELARWLVPGGILVLETPDCRGVTEIRSRHDYNMIGPLGHINGFTRRTLASLAMRRKFRPIGRGPAHVTPDLFRVVKRELRHALGFDGRSTQLYFRFCPE